MSSMVVLVEAYWALMAVMEGVVSSALMLEERFVI